MRVFQESVFATHQILKVAIQPVKHDSKDELEL